MEKIRFGVIGCGGVATRCFLPAIEKVRCAELISVASMNHDNARKVAEKYGCGFGKNNAELLARKDIDAIYIATPISSHVEIAIAAADAGKHVLCEKSLGMDLDQVQSIIDACSDNKVLLLEGYAYRFHTQHGVFMNRVNKGEIGRPILFQARFGFPPRPDNDFRYVRELGGGALLDAGAYTIHATRTFFGREPIKICASMENEGHEVDIRGTILLDFGEGQTALLAYGFNNMYQNSYSVWGTKGKITLTRVFSAPPDFMPTMIVERQNYSETNILAPCDHFAEEINAFCNAIDDRDTWRKWRTEALAQAQTMHKVREAAAF